MRKLDERGKQCPMPVIEAKQALAEAAPGEMIEVIVDNEIAVQNPVSYTHLTLPTT